GAEDHGVFCDDTLRVVFATQKVVDLFDAYGQKLELMLRASSGKHPKPGGPREASGALTAVDIGAVISAIGGGPKIPTPWKQAVYTIDFGPCVDRPPPPENASIDIRYPLEPCTDYLIDVVRKPKAGSGGEKLIFRRGFTSG